MLKLQSWVDSPEVQDLIKLPTEQMVTERFFRDPLRTIYRDKLAFLSPADGTVLYTSYNWPADGKLLEIKGKDYSIQDILCDKNYNQPSIVIGIFMTFYDVHINRMPTDGYVVSERATPSILTHRTAMLPVEQNIIENLKLNTNHMGYLFENERKIIKIRSDITDYYLVQIADREVDVIANWCVEERMSQGDRIGVVRYGSQVDLIIPSSEIIAKYATDIIAKPMHHVKAGEDILIQLHRR